MRKYEVRMRRYDFNLKEFVVDKHIVKAVSRQEASEKIDSNYDLIGEVVGVGCIG